MNNKSTKISNIKKKTLTDDEYHSFNNFDEKNNHGINLDTVPVDMNKNKNKNKNKIKNNNKNISQKQNPPKYNPIPDQKYISKVDPDRLKKLSENANKSIASKNFYDLTLFEIAFGLYENINLIISDLQIFFHMLSNGTATFKQLLNIFLNKTRIFYIGILMVFISFILFILN